jgi:hypothetical protein
MRNGQNKRMRGRNRRGHNPLTRVYESNGPDVKIRGTAHHIAEKYLQLARDAQASGDPVAGESYLQHAEHYFRLIAAAQAQFAPQHPHQQQQHQHSQQQQYQRPDMDARDDAEFDSDEGASPEQQAGQPYAGGQPMAQTPRPQPPQPQPQPNFQGYSQQREPESRDVGLPSFITGSPAPGGGNGYDNEQGDRDGGRFGRRRRRFRPRGPGDFEPRGGEFDQRAEGGSVPSTSPAQPSGSGDAPSGEGEVPPKPAGQGE